MPLFRPHRGLLSDSLAETVIVKNEEMLRQIIYETWKYWLDHPQNPHPSQIHDYKIKISEHGGLDKRCGWYTHIVSCNVLDRNEFFPVGYLSEPMEISSKNQT